jgi:hypothetical protein
MKNLLIPFVQDATFLFFQKKIKLFLFFSLFLTPFLFGQACQNLLSSGDFSNGLTAGATTALAQACTPANCTTGSYCIGNNLQNKCNLWPATIANSTPSAGNFLMVDGFTNGTAPFNIWRQTAAIPVVFGKTYSFSFWVASVNNPLVAGQQFSLDMVIAPTNAGFLPTIQAVPITSTGWTKYTKTYTPAAGVTSVNVSVQQGSAGAYRDFGLDDINFSCACDVSIVATGNCVSYQVGTTVCGTGPYTYQWCNGQINANYTTSLPCGNNTLCVTMTDATGCKASATQIVNITDNIPPLIVNCPQNTTVNTNQGQCTYTIPTPWTITATDNCDPNPVVTLVYTAPSGVTSTTLPSVLTKGVNTFVYQAKDKCNNLSKQCAFTITVIDTEKPTITCPQNVTVQGVSTPPPTVCKVVVANISPVAFGDNCSMATVSYTITGATTASGATNASGQTFMQGVSTVTYIITDMAGNITTCSFTVTVVCPKCDCSKFLDMYARVTQGAPNKLILCGDTLNIGCKPTFSPIIGGFFQCIGGTACPDSALVNWVLNGPSSPNLGNGNIYAKPNFSLTLSGSYFSTPGFYELVLTGVCNGIKCPPCKIYFKVLPINFNNNLTAYFPFTGNTKDASPTLSNGVGNSVTLNGANNAYIFNGTTSWIDCGVSNRGVTDQVSVCAWVKTSELTKGLWVAGQYLSGNQPKGYLLSIGNVTNGNIGLASFSGRVDASSYYTATSLSTIKVNDGKWHCLVGTAGNGEWRIYVDGILRGSTPGLTTPSISATNIGVPFSIGQASSGANPMWYNGEMDEVRLYNRVLTECEVEALCKANLISGTDDLSEKMMLRIFPNPNAGSFTLELPVLATPDMKLHITDLAGRLVMEKATESGNQLQNVDTGNLPNGLYFVHIIANGKTIAVEKFIKQ